MLFFPAEAFDPSISYKTHLVGFLLGLAWGLTYFLFNRKRIRQAERYRLILDEEPSLPAARSISV